MRAALSAFALLMSCSDYDLSSGDKPAGGGDGGAPGDGGAGMDGGGDGGSDPPDDETGDGGTGDGGTGDGGDTGPPVDAQKIDVVVLVDVAYFYDCYHPELELRVTELADALGASGHDVAMAVASYDDYNLPDEWWVATGGRPYTLEQQMTEDLDLVRATATRLEMVWGGDGPGSGYEAVVQALKGRGYDQTCDGVYDSSRDIKPFEAYAGDAFGGGVAGVYNSGVPGTGDRAGVGFRPGATRVLVLAVENSLRDRDYGHELPTGACLGVASSDDAVTALTDSDARFVAINAYEFQDLDGTPQDQLESLATRTASRWDADHDGVKDELAVLSGSWDWPPVDQLLDVILQVAEAG